MKSSVVHQSTILTYAGRSLSTLFFLSFFLLRHSMHCITLRHGDCQSFFSAFRDDLTLSCDPSHLREYPTPCEVKERQRESQARKTTTSKTCHKFYYFTVGPNGFKLLSRSNFFSAKSKGWEKIISISVFLRLFLWGRGHPLPMTLDKRFTSYVVGRKNVQLSLFITNHIRNYEPIY